MAAILSRPQCVTQLPYNRLIPRSYYYAIAYDKYLDLKAWQPSLEEELTYKRPRCHTL